nr:M24 family metallopeptidase C-terminal domain-containing protein [bacterium]
MVFVEKHKDKFLKLAQMTYCPYERELIDVKMLDQKELDWINKYHKIVLKKLKPMIKDRAMLDWLKKACAPLI